MAVLITGANGFLGGALAAHFRAAGRPATGTSRRRLPGLLQVGEIDGATDWQAALRGVEVVVHCAGLAHIKAAPSDFQRVNVDGTLNLARQAVEAGVTRFIFISSIGVNGSETRGRPFAADDEPRPRKPYAISKRRAEDGLKLIADQTGLEVVIIRPPLILGPGAKGNIELLAKLVGLRLPTPFGLSRNRRDVVSLPHLCRFVEACVSTPVANRTFLVGDGFPLSTRELIDRVAADNGRRAPIHLPVPLGLLGGLLTAAGLDSLRSQLLGDLEVDSTPAEALTRS